MSPENQSQNPEGRTMKEAPQDQTPAIDSPGHYTSDKAQGKESDDSTQNQNQNESK